MDPISKFISLFRFIRNTFRFLVWEVIFWCPLEPRTSLVMTFGHLCRSAQIYNQFFGRVLYVFLGLLMLPLGSKGFLKVPWGFIGFLKVLALPVTKYKIDPWEQNVWFCLFYYPFWIPLSVTKHRPCDEKWNLIAVSTRIFKKYHQ